MTARLCAVVALAVCLPHLDDAPTPTPTVMRACRALLDASASISVEDVSVLGLYLDNLSRRRGLPDEGRQLLTDAMAALMGRRVRNHRPRQRRGRRTDRGGGSGPLTATMQVSVG